MNPFEVAAGKSSSIAATFTAEQSHSLRQRPSEVTSHLNTIFSDGLEQLSDVAGIISLSCIVIDYLLDRFFVLVRDGESVLGDVDTQTESAGIPVIDVLEELAEAPWDCRA